ncbi:MAG: hypothetical protein ABSF90_27390 [Syntrophobacteraceae bacterium]
MRNCPIQIKSEEDLVKEIARIANLSMKSGYQLEVLNRMLSKEEAYVQMGHSASLLKTILDLYPVEGFSVGGILG